MHALRILVLDGVEFGDVRITAPLPRLAHLSWRYGKAPRFPFELRTIQTAGVLIMRGVDCLQPLLDGLQVCHPPLPVVLERTVQWRSGEHVSSNLDLHLSSCCQ